MTRSKYNARITVIDGIKFRSAGEAKRYQQLKLLEQAGQIRNLELQPVFKLILPDGTPILTKKGRTMRYTSDFAYFEGNQRIVEEYKGFETKDGYIRRAVAEAVYKINVRVVR